jgi:hypothetical protein
MSGATSPAEQEIGKLSLALAIWQHCSKKFAPTVLMGIICHSLYLKFVL